MQLGLRAAARQKAHSALSVPPLCKAMEPARRSAGWLLSLSKATRGSLWAACCRAKNWRLEKQVQTRRYHAETDRRAVHTLAGPASTSSRAARASTIISHRSRSGTLAPLQTRHEQTCHAARSQANITALPHSAGLTSAGHVLHCVMCVITR